MGFEGYEKTRRLDQTSGEAIPSPRSGSLPLRWPPQPVASCFTVFELKLKGNAMSSQRLDVEHAYNVERQTRIPRSTSNTLSVMLGGHSFNEYGARKSSLFAIFHTSKKR